MPGMNFIPLIIGFSASSIFVIVSKIFIKIDTNESMILRILTTYDTQLAFLRKRVQVAETDFSLLFEKFENCYNMVHAQNMTINSLRREIAILKEDR